MKKSLEFYKKKQGIVCNLIAWRHILAIFIDS